MSVVHCIFIVFGQLNKIAVILLFRKLVHKGLMEHSHKGHFSMRFAPLAIPLNSYGVYSWGNALNSAQACGVSAYYKPCVSFGNARKLYSRLNALPYLAFSLGLTEISIFKMLIKPQLVLGLSNNARQTFSGLDIHLPQNLNFICLRQIVD